MSDAPSTTASGAAAAPLDEVMLAMDVVDTLRRKERMVRKELDTAGREEDLKERLKRIYTQQGIEVSDAVIKQGVAALKEDRFTYRPPADSIQVKLARLYVSRGRWGKWVAGIAGASVLAGALYYIVAVAPDKALPEDLAELHTRLAALATTERARQGVDQAFAAGEAALSNHDTEGARAALGRLGDLQHVLEQEYTLRIVNRPGKRSGVWRVPDVNTRAKNYYLIVEAVDPAGRTVKVPVESEETRKTSWVDTWGLRVDHATYESVANDKRDDGIIQRDRFGYKPRGALAPTYEMQTTGGAITRW